MPEQRYYKNNSQDKIWWLDTGDILGEWVFSFDRKKNFNLYHDYPQKLTPEQKKLFDSENPFWAHYFRDRK